MRQIVPVGQFINKAALLEPCPRFLERRHVFFLKFADQEEYLHGTA
jgi:hypothetical protein